MKGAPRRVLDRLERAPAWSLVAVFVALGTFVVVLMLTGRDESGLPFLLLLAAYTVAVYRPAVEVLTAAVAMSVLLIVLLLGDSPNFGGGELVGTAVAFGAAMLIGWTTRQRMEASQQAQVEAALRAAADERLRIAQELHDVVAHSLGVIAVQAGVGMHVIGTDVAEAQRSFDAIARTSRASLAEIRGLLGVLRGGAAAPAYAPAPTLADVKQLVGETSGTTGLAIDLHVSGDLERVPRGVGLAGYRIVQESLTNTVRHAHARRATVRIDCTSGTMLIEVSDDGRGSNGDHVPGNGLIGMRERVALYGGSVATDSPTGGGFVVSARLPFDAETVA